MDKFDRRTVIMGASGVAASLLFEPAIAQSGREKMEEKPFTIGMVAFDMMTNIDFVGPCDVFSRVRAARPIILAKSLDPIKTDSGYRMLPDMRLEDAPELDMIFVPGGPGSTKLMEDPQMIAFLRERAPKAQWVTSVCTGALVLGAAGLLKGYRAATHWSAMEVLPMLGAIPVKERVVIDRNRITGGGATAGIDFGLTLVGHIWGEDQAKLIQMGNEYNPQPPFDAGHPDRAPEVAARFRAIAKNVIAARIDAAKRIAIAGF